MKHTSRDAASRGFERQLEAEIKAALANARLTRLRLERVLALLCAGPAGLEH